MEVQQLNLFGKKKRSKRAWSVIISTVILASCSGGKSNALDGFQISGDSQGTTYTIIVAEETLNFSKSDIDHILADFDTILSTYIPSSEISRFNASEKGYSFVDKQHYFKKCYESSDIVYNESNSLFDPSVFPLVEGWGFFKHMETPLSKEKVDSILHFVSFKKEVLHSIKFRNDSVIITKKDPRFKLDFNAIAQGYAVDVLYDFIESKGHSNFYIELGGELRVAGKNREHGVWNIGIDTPEDLKNSNSTRKISGILSVTDKAVATSGNYRNYYEKEGKKYAHTLHPITGFPVSHNLLSATVIADNGALADGFATAFMVMGLEEAKKHLQTTKIPLEVVFIYQSKEGKLEFYTTKGAEKMLEN